jgi:hypothetical protein
MSFSPRSPQLPPRPREVATQVVKQEKSGAINPNVIVLKKKKHPLELPRRGEISGYDI